MRWKPVAWILTLAVVTGIVIPTLVKTRNHPPAPDTACASTLRELARCSMLYAEEHGAFPVAQGESPRAHESLNVLIEHFPPMAFSPEHFVCRGRPGGVAERGPDGRVRLSEDTCAFAWTKVAIRLTDDPVPVVSEKSPHHDRDGILVGFSDGSVSLLAPDDSRIGADGVPVGLAR